jgi:hypothetical protein
VFRAVPAENDVVVKALTVAVVVWLSGFGALLGFHLFMPREEGLPGLFDFASATWGDGLALPVMAAALAYGITRLPPAHRERALSGAAGLLGGLVGAATQVQWLLDQAPRVNWTFPRPHHFNAAGWYHAGFLTLMSAVSAFLWMLALVRLVSCSREATGDRRPAAVGVVVGFLAAATFAVLLAVDAAPDPRTASSTATAVAAAAGGVLLCGGLLFTGVSVLRGRSPSDGPVSARSR